MFNVHEITEARCACTWRDYSPLSRKLCPDHMTKPVGLLNRGYVFIGNGITFFVPQSRSYKGNPDPARRRRSVGGNQLPALLWYCG